MLDIKHHIKLMSRHHLEGFALFPPAVEAPFVGEVAALLGFDRLDGAGVDALEEDAGAVGVRLQHETRAAGAELGVLRDEFGWGELEEGGDGIYFLVIEADEARPAAAVAAEEPLLLYFSERPNGLGNDQNFPPAA
jgi:hypothetical protein